MSKHRASEPSSIPGPVQMLLLLLVFGVLVGVLLGAQELMGWR